MYSIIGKKLANGIEKNLFYSLVLFLLYSELLRIDNVTKPETTIITSPKHSPFIKMVKIVHGL